MRKNYSFYGFFALLVSLLFVLCACGNSVETASQAAASEQPSAVTEPQNTAGETQTQPPAASSCPTQSASAVSQGTGEFFPWIVYWDNETAIPESSLISPAMGSISVFAAYFKGDDSIVFPQSSEDTLKIVRDQYGSSLPTYLTFVNDIKYDDGSSSLKDADILRRLFSGQARMNAHIDEIIALAKAKGVDGIEIDYENLSDDEALCGLFADFLNALKDRAQSEGFKLRVVLETSALTKVTFPAGPEYTIMVYNLYGSHSSETGPKADQAFITETASKSVCLGPNVCFAFATGGFDWSSSGDIKSLSEADAADLAATTKSKPVRDPNSGALTFTYQNDATHTVWYADGETLCFWMDTAKAAGINNFAMWRLGGNCEDSLRKISDYLKK